MCESTTPGVAISPSAGMIPVAALIGTSMPSIVSGLPARPTHAIRPSLMPSEVFRMPSTGSMTTAFVITASRASSPRMELDARSPSRIVFPKPISGSLPGAVSSASTSASRLVSPSRIRSPVVGP